MYAYSRLDFCAIRDDFQKLATTRFLGQRHREHLRRLRAVILHPGCSSISYRWSVFA
jgi:hypothetical protein